MKRAEISRERALSAPGWQPGRAHWGNKAGVTLEGELQLLLDKGGQAGVCLYTCFVCIHVLVCVCLCVCTHPPVWGRLTTSQKWRFVQEQGVMEWCGFMGTLL